MVTKSLSKKSFSFPFSSFLKLVTIILIICLNEVSAEGTKQVSPSEDRIAALQFSPNTNLGSGFNASQEDRIYFHISDHALENFYFGARVMTAGNASNLTDVFYSIKDSAGNVVFPATRFLSNITSYNQAVAGPNINNLRPNGYVPRVFDPTMNGDFYIEFYRSSTAGLTNNITAIFIAPWFDFNVGEANGVLKSGRIYCENWSFITAKSSTNFSGSFEEKLDFDLFTYTSDGVVIKVIFNDIQPLGFFAAFNDYGVNPNQTNWQIGRKSIYSGPQAPQLINSYKTFLVEPDPIVYPSSSLAAPPIIESNIVGCPGSYLIPFTSHVEGDVKFILDLNEVSGFQANTRDRVLEVNDVSIGKNLLPWDGMDGQGNLVPQNSEVMTTVSMLRGRVNLPVFDAEININGFSFEMVRPVTVPNLRMFWDDSELASVTGRGNNLNNTTGAGIKNIEIGQVSPGHAWNGPYGTNLIVPPAPANGGGDFTPILSDDDFGNVRTINTWFWGLEEKSGNLSFRIPYCNTVSGMLLNDKNGLSDGVINGSEIIGSESIYILLVDSLNVVKQAARVDTDGKFIFSGIDSGDYSLVLSDSDVEINNQAPPPYTLPSNWVLVGEGILDNNDGLPNGEILISLENSDLTSLAFGLQKRPDSYSETFQIINSNGSNKIPLPELKGDDLEDGSLGFGSILKILSLPINGVLYYDNAIVWVNDVFINYIPSLLRIDPDFDNAGSLSFNFTFVDTNGLESSLPATILLDMNCQSQICVPIEFSKN